MGAGTGQQPQENKIEIKNPGSLKKFGYHLNQSQSSPSRRRALRQAIEAYGALAVIKNLLAVANLTATEKNRAKYLNDINYIRKQQ